MCVHVHAYGLWPKGNNFNSKRQEVIFISKMSDFAPSLFCWFFLFFSSAKTISQRSRKAVIIVIVWQEQGFMNNRMQKDPVNAFTFADAIGSKWLELSEQRRERDAWKGRAVFWAGPGCRYFSKSCVKVAISCHPAYPTSVWSVLRGPLVQKCQQGSEHSTTCRSSYSPKSECSLCTACVCLQGKR